MPCWVVRAPDSSEPSISSRRNSRFPWLASVNDRSVAPSTGPFRPTCTNVDRSVPGNSPMCIRRTWSSFQSARSGAALSEPPRTVNTRKVPAVPASWSTTARDELSSSGASSMTRTSHLLCPRCSMASTIEWTGSSALLGSTPSSRKSGVKAAKGSPEAVAVARTITVVIPRLEPSSAAARASRVFPTPAAPISPTP